MKYLRNHEGSALFYEHNLFHKLQLKPNMTLKSDVTLLCIIAMSTTNAG